MTQVIKSQALILCYLLVFFSCTKEKETEHSYPRVTTGLVTNINAGGATFNGSFLQTGNSEIIDHGFVFGTNAFPNIQRNEKISLGSSEGKGSFTATANFGMKIGETYYVSAYAQNKNKIFYAEHIIFISMGSLPPEIFAVIPSEGLRGDTVVIKGKYFSQQTINNIVKFGDVSANIIAVSDTALTVRVPTSNGIEQVDVFVTSVKQTAQKINGFRYLSPVITDLSPSQAVIGDTVTIRGQHFERMKDQNIAKFRNNQASIIYASDTVLIVKVPSSDGVEHVDVFVTASGITTYKINGFQYLKPVITDFSLTQTVIGDTITITGQNFRPNMEIRFNQVRAKIYQSDHSSARVIVPACQSTSADISVTVDGLTGIAEQKFIYAKAEVTGLSADYGVIGDTILIYGKNFGYQKDAVSVFLGVQSATVLDVNNLSIKVIVSASGGKTSLPVTVRVDGQLGEGNQMFNYLAPVIESFEPKNACGGDTVVIRGQYFLTTNQLSVSFGTYSVDRFGMITDMEIQAVVPFSKGVEELSISVKNNGITSISEERFRYLKPEIINIAPDKGLKNDQVIITGQHFGKYSSNLSVYFDGNVASVLEHYPDKIIVSVPKFSGNKFSEMKVIRDGLTTVSQQKFQYMEPVITDFSASSGRVGNTVTINGQYFSNNKNDVRVYCDDFQLEIETCTDNQIIVTIPNTAASAKQPIRVIVDGHEGVSAASFEIISPWTKKAAQPNYGTDFPMTWTYKNEGYIALSDCRKYNPAEDQWQIILNNWDNRFIRHEPVYFQIGDYFYYGSGIGVDDNFYQVSLESLEKKSIAKIQQLHGAFSFIIDNKAYVCGGSGYNTLRQFDSQTEEWTQKASLPAPGRMLGIAFSHNGKGYAGLGGYIEFYNDFYEYDPQTDKWTQKTDFPGRGVYGSISFTINNQIFVGLGASLNGYAHESMRHIWEYIPASDTWRQVAIIPNEGGYGVSVFVINNKAYIAGGSGRKDFYEFDPSKL